MKYYIDAMMQGDNIPMYRYEVEASNYEEAMSKVAWRILDYRVIWEPSNVTDNPHYGEKCKDVYKLPVFIEVK